MKSVAKRILPYAWGALSHVGIVLSLMFFVFLVVDRYNRAMAFVNNEITKGLLVLAALITIALHRILLPTSAGCSKRTRILIRDLSTLCLMLCTAVLFVIFLDKEIMIINTSAVKLLVALYSACLLLISLASAITHYRKLNPEQK